MPYYAKLSRLSRTLIPVVETVQKILIKWRDMTELIWDGKYKEGKKVAPVKIALPFQTIETVNESVQERQRTLDLFSTGRDPEWRNRLIWGDKSTSCRSTLYRNLSAR